MSSRARQWISAAVGVVAVVCGAALTLKPFSSLDALTVFIAASLVAAGVGELLAARRGGDAWTRWISGAALTVAGVLALAWPGLTVRAVAGIVGVALVVGGGARLVGAWRGVADERLASALGGAASLILGVLALAWPDLSVLVVALLVGPAAIVLGAGQVVRAMRGGTRSRDRSAPGRARRIWHVARALGALGLALVLAGVSVALHRGEASLDGFYTTPTDLPDRPGVLLAEERFTREVPPGADAARILYTTTGDDGRTTPASGLVVWPRRARGPVPVILWTHGTTGVARRCAPSALDAPFTAGALFVLPAIIDAGWAVVAPDYPGLGAEGEHPYLVGRPAARSALDAVRAARALQQAPLGRDTVSWGHSQGGGAALWTGMEARAYAPDVPLAGVAALAPASDVLALARGLQTSPAGMLFATFVVEGYSNAYADVRFGAYIRPAAQTAVREVVGRCLSDPATIASLPTVLTGQTIFRSDLTAGPLVDRLRQNVPGRPSGIPTLVAQGLDDALVLPEVQRRFVADLCAAGQVVDERTYPGRDHLALVAADSPLIPDLLAWTRERLAGTPGPRTCTAPS